MKDIKDIEIKSGDKVHIFGNSIKDDDPIDINAIVLNTRGRGIKFIDEVTSKEYTSDYIKEHGYKVHVLNSNQPSVSTGEQTKSKHSKSSSPAVTQKDLDVIDTLIKLGWYGTISKKVGDTVFKVQLPEYE